MYRSGLLKWAWFLALLTILWTGTATAEADVGLKGWGLRGGLTVEPDQVFVGGHMNLGEIAEGLFLLPNLTVAFGDNMTIVALSPDVGYAFPVPDVGVLYVGGLLTFQWITRDMDSSAEMDHPMGHTDAELGLHAFGGLFLESVPVFFELNVGIDDAPDLKVAIGYTFPLD